MDKNVKFKYVRDAFSNRILATIAIVDGNKIGYAYPHKKDAFSKKRGREIALGRALAGTRPEREPNKKVSVFVGGRLILGGQISFAVREAIEHALKGLR